MIEIRVFMKKVISKEYWQSYLLIFLLTVLSQGIFAKKEEENNQSKKSLEVLKSVENAYVRMQSLQSELKKTTTLKVLQRETVYTGTLKVKKGGYLRIDMTSPVKSILLINPKGTWHTQYPEVPEFDDKIRVIKTKTKSALQIALLSILEEGKILEHFYLLSSKSAETSHIFKLSAKEEANMIPQLEIVVDTLFLITKITYWDSLQNKTVLEFHDILLNKNIENDIFEFKKPPNAEIIEN